MDADGYENMFVELPEVFHESALIERFHGFIKGWNIPRMNDDLKVCGWALNSEYFCAIMHELRSDMSYRTIVDELIEVPDGADTRDTEAVKRIATAYLKLLFPHVQKVSDISSREFKRYCLDRRDPEMHQTNKGNEWYFGMKVHAGVDAGSGYVHTITGTSANMHDVTETANLIREDDEVVYGDS